MFVFSMHADSPSCPTLAMKSLMYGPGRPLSASKHNAVSSVTQAVPSWSEPNIQMLCCRTDLLGRSLDFGYGYLLRRTLQLWH